MLTQLSTVKSRLAIPAEDTTSDTLLSNAIKAVSARFDKETRRTLARTENATEEFSAGDTEIVVSCYPVETVSKFEFKTSEAAGWQEIDPAPDYVIRGHCIISVGAGLARSEGGIACGLFRVVYTAGYVLPGTAAEPGRTPLPDDLEQAAVEQVAYWYQNRDRLGAIRFWPKGGVYEQFADVDLLPGVRAVLEKYAKWGG